MKPEELVESVVEVLELDQGIQQDLRDINRTLVEKNAALTEEVEQLREQDTDVQKVGEGRLSVDRDRLMHTLDNMVRARMLDKQAAGKARENPDRLLDVLDKVASTTEKQKLSLGNPETDSADTGTSRPASPRRESDLAYEEGARRLRERLGSQ